jgi:hypothetical protein
MTLCVPITTIWSAVVSEGAAGRDLSDGRRPGTQEPGMNTTLVKWLARN